MFRNWGSPSAYYSAGYRKTMLIQKMLEEADFEASILPDFMVTKSRWGNIFLFIRYLWELPKKIESLEKGDLIIYETNRLFTLVPLRVLAGWKNIQMVYQIEEWYWRKEYLKQGYRELVRGFNYSFLYPLMAQRIITISKFLSGKFKKPIFLLPAIEEFKLLPDLERKNQFVYCASTAYWEEILWIINSFELLGYDEVKLILVISGRENAIHELKKIITGKEDKIILKTKIPDDELYGLYLTSIGLLLPMKDDSKNKARMPQKITAYTMSRTPVIMSKVGDLMDWFEPYKSFVPIEEDLTAAMRWVILNREKALKIGKEGTLVGEKHFNYKNFVQPLASFLK